MSAALPLLPPSLPPTNPSNVRSCGVEALCLRGPPVLRVWFPARRIAPQLHKARFFFFLSFLLPSTAALLNSSVSSLRGDLRRSGGHAGVTDTQADQQMPSHSPPAGGFRSGELPSKHCCRDGASVGRPRSRGHSGSWPSPSFYSPVSVSFLWLELCTHIHVCLVGAMVASYMHTHTLIQLSPGSVSLWLITVCSPPCRCWVRIRRRR